MSKVCEIYLIKPTVVLYRNEFVHLFIFFVLAEYSYIMRHLFKNSMNWKTLWSNFKKARYYLIFKYIFDTLYMYVVEWKRTLFKLISHTWFTLFSWILMLTLESWPLAPPLRFVISWIAVDITIPPPSRQLCLLYTGCDASNRVHGAPASLCWHQGDPSPHLTKHIPSMTNTEVRSFLYCLVNPNNRQLWLLFSHMIMSSCRNKLRQSLCRFLYCFICLKYALSIIQ